MKVKKMIIYQFLVAALLSASPFAMADSVKDDSIEQQRQRSFPQDYQFDVYASRDNNGWGAVYMNREDVGKSQGHIVDDEMLPELDSDPQLQHWQQLFADSNAFQSRDGKEIYHHSCAGCHMHDGEGGMGAGYYPPLADNPKMSSEDYIYSIMINGFRGMPYFRDMLDDEQMVAVVRYIQQELNDYEHELHPKDVAALRHDNPPAFDPSDG